MSSGDTYKAQDVFTPTKPARATFIEREAINDKLVSALRTPGKQIVVYGHSGSGKTTLLVNKLHQLYENHITTRCVLGMTFDQLLLNAFDQLNVFYESEKVRSKKSQISSSISAEYATIRAQVGSQLADESQTKQQRVVPPQLIPQTLARFLGEAKCCWVLEDFHKVEDVEKKKLAQVMKLFMDMSDDYSDLKIIAIGAVDTARQVIEYDAEMRNRVSEIHVPLMSDQELLQIINRGEELLNFSIISSAKNSIVRYSNGLASVCHQLCLNICFAAGINTTLSRHIRISDNELQKALKMYLENASDTIKSAFDKALRQVRKSQFNNSKLILRALTKFGQDGASRSDILAMIKKDEPRYPPANLALYLDKLQTNDRGSVLRFESASGRYSFSDPIYRVFAMSSFLTETPNRIPVAKEDDIIRRLDEMLKKLRIQIDERGSSNTP